MAEKIFPSRTPLLKAKAKATGFKTADDAFKAYATLVGVSEDKVHAALDKKTEGATEEQKIIYYADLIKSTQEARAKKAV